MGEGGRGKRGLPLSMVSSHSAIRFFFHYKICFLFLLSLLFLLSSLSRIFLTEGSIPIEQETKTNCAHRRTSRGGRGGLQPPQLQKFLKFFGQNAHVSGKSTREKIILKVVKARLEGYFLSRLPCQDGVKVK